MRKLIFLFLIMLLFAWQPAAARMLVDEAGTRLEIPEAPQRLLPLSPSLAEILFALGLEKRIVGVTDLASYPPEARKKPKVGSFYSPSLEKILALKPDLVIAGSERQDERIYDSLRNFSIPVYRIRPLNLDSIYASISRLGEITGTLEAAQRVILKMKKKAARVEAGVAGMPPKRVFYQVGIDPLVTVNRQTFAADLIKRAGGVLVTADNPQRYPPYSIERVIADAPEVIIISSMSPNTNYQRFRQSWRRWQTIPAVRKDQIFVIDSDMVDRPSPRIVDGLEKMADFIHGRRVGRGGTGQRFGK